MTSRSLPRIGLTMYGRAPKTGYSLPAEYVDTVRRAGGLPILLPPGEPDPAVWLELVDALVLTGGGDLDPECYGGSAHETVYMVDAERDRTELELARACLETELPLLGICRGTQVLNVALGGTLHEHLPDVVGNAIAHRLPPREPTPHWIAIEAGSKLHRITGREQLEAASWHHQAIDRIAAPLVPVAYAPDGVIEAVEMPGHPWFLAVQWHPELTAASDPLQQRIVSALVDAARAHRAGPHSRARNG